jgi:hypothetical protein
MLNISPRSGIQLISIRSKDLWGWDPGRNNVIRVYRCIHLEHCFLGHFCDVAKVAIIYKKIEPDLAPNLMKVKFVKHPSFLLATYLNHA